MLAAGASGPSAVKVLVPQSDRVLVNVVSAADALYIEARDGNIKRLYKLPHGMGGGTP